MNKWTVHVTDFGKIEKAEVQVAPLTLFLGDNNSGKSYMMTLIYGLLNVRFFFSGYLFDKETETYCRCCEIVDRILQEPIPMSETAGKKYTLNQEEHKLFEKLINEVLRINKKKFLRELFNRDMDMGEFYLEFSQDCYCNLEVCYTPGKEDGVVLYGLNDAGMPRTGCGPFKREMSEVLRYKFALSYIMEHMIENGFCGLAEDEAVYFPTARTGYLLTYRTLVGSAMQEKFSLDDTAKNLLTKPNSDFLASLSSMSMEKRKKNRYASVLEFIEENLLNGHIGVSDLPVKDIMYMPNGGSEPLPMYVTSGVVTEVTPLLLFLRYGETGTILMEEPEISLHPQLQWKMARVLIQLTNAGVPVFITTHSDIILQHINNMIKLRELPDRDYFMERAGYKEEDLLKRQDVAVYQFEVKGNMRTQVTKLPCGDYGFEAMTFYQTLKTLNDQIDELENMEE